MLPIKRKKVVKVKIKKILNKEKFFNNLLSKQIIGMTLKIELDTGHIVKAKVYQIIKK